MLNHVAIMGRLTRDPELRRTGSNIAVTTFTIACDRDIANKETGEKDTDFIDVVVWRGAAEFTAKHFRKGSMIAVTGRLQKRNWTDNDGNKRSTVEVVAENVYFGEAKKSSDGNAQQGGYNPGSYERVVNHPEKQSFQHIDIPDAQLPF